MINSLEILEKLRKGETIENIGKQIAAVLNCANEQYEKEQEAKKHKEQKLNELTSIISTFMDWFETYYETVYNNKDANPKELAQSLIESFDLFKDIGIQDLYNQMKKDRKSGDSFLSLVNDFLNE